MPRIPTAFRIALAIAFAMTIVPAQLAQAQTYTVLHNFSNGADGGSPESMLTLDSAGNLYGTTLYGGTGYGTVFEMVKGNGSWNLSTLYDFKGDSGNNDGAGPIARVVFGPAGYLYGTTVAGGGGESNGCAGFTYFGCGTVFSLIPPFVNGGEDEVEETGDRTDGAEPLMKICIIDCPWSEHVLFHLVNGSAGVYPYGGVAFDSTGNIYGTTQLGDGLGTVYELEANSLWNESVLVSFTGSNGGEPYDTLVVSSSGNLYGSARGGGENGQGVLFELSNTGSGWVENIIHSFSGSDGSAPFGGLIFDSAGNLYGTTSSGGSGHGGTVFELSPSGGGWQFTLLYSFTGSSQWGPADSVTIDSAGDLYGTTYLDGAHNLGSVFKLTHSNGGWTYSDLHDFGGDPDGCEPNGGVVLDSHSNIYGTTTGCGTYPNQYGTVWEITQ
jgi:uncharacterized repeat protein (TIGR03803 family)